MPFRDLGRRVLLSIQAEELMKPPIRDESEFDHLGCDPPHAGENSALVEEEVAGTSRGEAGRG